MMQKVNKKEEKVFFNKNKGFWFIFKDYFLCLLPICLISYVFDVITWVLPRQIIFQMNHVHYFNITLPIDNNIPFLVGFSIPYILFFAISWFIAPILLRIYFGKKSVYQYMIMFCLQNFVLMFFHIFVPILDDLRPYTIPNGWKWITDMYFKDSPTNQFPSGHVSVSLIFFITILFNYKKQPKKITIPYLISTFIYSVVIWISCVVLKQHHVLDVITGVLVAVIIGVVVYYTNITRSLWYSLTKLNILIKIENKNALIYIK